MKKNIIAISLVMAVVFLVNIACGTSSTAKKVGEVQGDQKQQDTLATMVAQTMAAPQPAGDSAEAKAEPKKEAAAPTNYKVGDIVEIGDVNMAVLGWSTPEGNQFMKPEEGKKFVSVEVIFVNKSSTAMHLSTLMQTTLKDETGQKYTVDLAASASSNKSPEGELAPGEKLRGEIGFQVPTDAKGLVFVFDASIFGTGKVFVDLGPDPVKVEPPAQLAGETQQQTYKVGDVVEIEKMTFVVNQVTSPAGTQFAKPEAGKKFVVVDMTIQNKGSEAAAVSTLMQMTLKDDSGQSYSVDLMATTASGGSTVDGEIAAGEKVRGQVGFQVPENAKGLTFVYDASVFGTGKIFVSMQ